MIGETRSRLTNNYHALSSAIIHFEHVQNFHDTVVDETLSSLTAHMIVHDRLMIVWGRNEFANHQTTIAPFGRGLTFGFCGKKILECDHSNESSLTVVTCGSVYFTIFPNEIWNFV